LRFAIEETAAIESTVQGCDARKEDEGNNAGFKKVNISKRELWESQQVF
jgi:hypothetical protein